MLREILFENIGTNASFCVQRRRITPIPEEARFFSFGYYYRVIASSDLSNEFVQKAIALAQKASKRIDIIDDLNSTTPDLFDSDLNRYQTHRLAHAIEHLAGAIINRNGTKALGRSERMNIDLRLTSTQGYTFEIEVEGGERIYTGFSFKRGFTTSEDIELEAIRKACEQISGL